MLCDDHMHSPREDSTFVLTLVVSEDSTFVLTLVVKNKGGLARL